MLNPNVTLIRVMTAEITKQRLSGKNKDKI